MTQNVVRLLSAYILALGLVGCPGPSSNSTPSSRWGITQPTAARNAGKQLAEAHKLLYDLQFKQSGAES